MSRNDIQIPSSIPLFSLVLSFFLAPTQVFKHIACPFFYYSLYVLSFSDVLCITSTFLSFSFFCLFVCPFCFFPFMHVITYFYLFSVCLSVLSVFQSCLLCLISIFFCFSPSCLLFENPLDLYRFFFLALILSI